MDRTLLAHLPVVLAVHRRGGFSAAAADLGMSASAVSHAVQAVEASLRRLNTDWIDLYQVHRPDHSTDIEETLSALNDLVTAGKIRAFGCSTFPPEEIVEAHWSAERHGLKSFRTEQSPYSLLSRGIEASVLPICARYRMGVLVWVPWGRVSCLVAIERANRSTCRSVAPRSSQNASICHGPRT